MASILERPEHIRDWNRVLDRAEKIGRDTVSMIFAGFCCGVIVGAVITTYAIISYASGG